MRTISFLSKSRRHAAQNSGAIHALADRLSSAANYTAVLDLSTVPASVSQQDHQTTTPNNTQPLTFQARGNVLTLSLAPTADKNQRSLSVRQLVDALQKAQSMAQLSCLLIDCNLDEPELAHFAALLSEQIVLLEPTDLSEADTSKVTAMPRLKTPMLTVQMPSGTLGWRFSDSLAAQVANIARHGMAA